MTLDRPLRFGAFFAPFRPVGQIPHPDRHCKILVVP